MLLTSHQKTIERIHSEMSNAQTQSSIFSGVSLNTTKIGLKKAASETVTYLSSLQCQQYLVLQLLYNMQAAFCNLQCLSTESIFVCFRHGKHA